MKDMKMPDDMPKEMMEDMQRQMEEAMKNLPPLPDMCVSSYHCGKR